MSNDDIKILIVDDDELNRDCAAINLERFIGYSNHVQADDGTSALQCLEANPDVNIVFLDRMMDKMNGIEMMHKMKENPAYKDIIVVFQTGDVGKPEKQECIDAGSYYILQKPYNDVEQGIMVHALAGLIRAKRRIKAKLEAGITGAATNFTFKTLEECEDVAAALASHFPKPLEIYDAIYELLSNAIEHGSLAMGYYEKNNKMKNGGYQEELKLRQSLSENSNKQVTATLEKSANSITLIVKDMGKGFSPSDYKEFGPDTLREPNGRGLYKIRQAFTKVEYAGGEARAVLNC